MTYLRGACQATNTRDLCQASSLCPLVIPLATPYTLGLCEKVLSIGNAFIILDLKRCTSCSPHTSLRCPVRPTLIVQPRLSTPRLTTKSARRHKSHTSRIYKTQREVLDCFLSSTDVFLIFSFTPSRAASRPQYYRQPHLAAGIGIRD